MAFLFEMLIKKSVIHMKMFYGIWCMRAHEQGSVTHHLYIWYTHNRVAYIYGNFLYDKYKWFYFVSLFYVNSLHIKWIEKEKNVHSMCVLYVYQVNERTRFFIFLCECEILSELHIIFIFIIHDLVTIYLYI